jgi:hypothetical protein
MKRVIAVSLGVVLLAALAVGLTSRSRAEEARHRLPASKDGNLVVGLCDGETSVEVAGVKENETLSPDQAKSVADQLMAEWRRKNPNASWDDTAVQTAKAEATGADRQSGGEGAAKDLKAVTPARAQSGVYGNFTDRDSKVWMSATDQFVADGKKIFHDANALGGTIAVSCDMCHPDASNTHPETYPKFQVQLGRVAMLRDMINWCIENPVRGKPLHDDDTRLKALEAYIIAQRKGVPLDYGKH